MTGKTIHLAIDAMGGDDGPQMVIPGLAIALMRCPELRFELHGDPEAIEPPLRRQWFRQATPAR